MSANEPKDVSGAFNPAKRATLKPKTRIRRTPEASAPAPEDATALQAADVPSARTTPASKPTPARKQNTTGKSRRIGCPAYLPADLHARVRACAAEPGMNYRKVLLAAMAATQPRLSELIAHDLRSASSNGGEDLWADTSARGSGPKLEMFFSGLTPAQTQALNDLTQRTGARDRSHLISVALTTYLDEKE